MNRSFWIHFLTECGNSGQTRIEAKNITLAIGVFYLRCPYQGARVIKAEEIISSLTFAREEHNKLEATFTD